MTLCYEIHKNKTNRTNNNKTKMQYEHPHNPHNLQYNLKAWQISSINNFNT